MHFTSAKGLLSAKNGMNIYRGCTHGCIYCDSRSLCYGMRHDFTDVEVKINAPELLENALRSKRKKCMIGTGSMSDPYNHCEDELHLTRKCAEIALEYNFGFTFITKSDKFLRDIDIYKDINENSKCVVQMTLTTYDERLCTVIEPNVSGTLARYNALKVLQKEGIPSVVWLSPILPFINDTRENMRGILDYCFDADVRGIIYFGAGLTLREGNREYYYEKLDKHFPGMKTKYIKTFGSSYECESPNNGALNKLFYSECERYGVLCRPNEVFGYLNEYDDRYAGEQLSMF